MLLSLNLQGILWRKLGTVKHHCVKVKIILNFTKKRVAGEGKVSLAHHFNYNSNKLVSLMFYNIICI